MANSWKTKRCVKAYLFFDKKIKIVGEMKNLIRIKEARLQVQIR